MVEKTILRVTAESEPAKGKREPESMHLAGVDPKGKVENVPEADH